MPLTARFVLRCSLKKVQAKKKEKVALEEAARAARMLGGEEAPVSMMDTAEDADLLF